MTPLLLFAALVTAQDVAPRDPGDVIPTIQRAIASGDTVRLTRAFERMAGGETHREVGRFGLGMLDLYAYRHDQADTALEQLARDQAGERVGAWATFGLALGMVTRGRLGRAIEHLQETVRLAAALPDSSLEAQALIILGPLVARNRGPAAGHPYLERADSLRPPGDSGIAARLFCTRAVLRTQVRDPAVPELIARGLETVPEEDLRGRGACEHARAVALQANGDLAAADSAFQESQTLFARAGDLAHLASILQWKGWNDWNAGYFRGAVPNLHAAVRLGRQTKNDMVIGWSLVNLAQIAVTFNDHAGAAAQLRAAREAFAHTADSAGLRAAANVEATHLAAIGAYAAADSIFRELVAFADRHGIVAWSMGLRGSWTEMHIRQGDLSEARVLLEEARAAIARGQLQGWNGPFDRLEAYLAIREGDFDGAERLLSRVERLLDPRQVGALYQLNAIRAHALLLREQPEDAYRRIRTATDQLERERRSLGVDALRRLAFQGGGLAQVGDASTAAVIAGLAASGNVAGAYEIAERRRARELLDRAVLAGTMGEAAPGADSGLSPASLDDVQRALPDQRTALVQYATGPNRTPTTGFVITADTAFAVILPSHDSLRPSIENLLARIQAGQAVEAIARGLGRVVLDPMVDALPDDIDRLMLVPDGALYRLPFAALRLSDDTYVVERFSVAYAPSGTVAVRSRPRNTGNGVRLLAIGDPHYEPLDDQGASFRTAYEEAGGLPRIRWSGREARRVARYADESDVLVRDEATEAAFKTMDLADYDVLHLATHALVDEGTVLRTSLALAPGDGQDGFVGVGELRELRLNADLVVLSGCRTAGGQVVAGEGLLGLSGPLLSAGAGVVVGTQWAVEDREVREYVDDFYGGLADGAEVADALRAAQLAGIERGDGPREWAVFAATGDPSVTVALERPPWWKFW
jgi:CHAT domain-containing protein/tetratricopeptide (TPR) repeat protein